MDVSSIASGTGQAASSAKTLTSNFETFLKLLTTQLQNQDPLQPMDSNQFTQQLVQYSGVEQNIYTNKNLESLIALQTQGTMSSAVSYMGRNVTADTDEGQLSKGAANWSYTLPSQAAKVQLTVSDAAGKTVYVGSGPTAAGPNTVTWNGSTLAGGTAPDGIYTLSVAATDAAGQALNAPLTFTGKVTGVETVNGNVVLAVGGLKLKLSDITAVSDATAAAAGGATT